MSAAASFRVTGVDLAPEAFGFCGVVRYRAAMFVLRE
jgi:hypothetical protein